MSTQEHARTPTLSEVLRALRNSIMRDLHVASVGRVTRYDAEKQEADVKPLLRRQVVYSDGEEGTPESIPVIPSVPVFFLRTSRFFVSMPIQRGDLVLLIFIDNSIDRYMSGQPGVEVDPGDFRTHDMTDAVAFAGLWPDSAALKQAHATNMVLGADDGGAQIHITPDGKVEIKLGGATAANSAALAEKLEALYGQLKSLYDAHTHATGTGPSGPPVVQAPAWDSSIASEKLKLED